MANAIKEIVMKKIFIKTELITNYIKANNLTIKQFCEVCNIKYYNYLQLMKGDGNIKIDVLYRLCKTTSIILNELVGINKSCRIMKSEE